MARYDVQDSSPSSPAMISSHTAVPQSPRSHGPSSSLAPPIICISASNEKPPLIRWPSEIIYPPPPPSTAVYSPLLFLPPCLPPLPGTCRLSTPSRMLFGAAAQALIAPFSISIWLECEWAGETGHLIAYWVSWGLSIAGRLWPSAWLNQRLCEVSGHIREPSVQF